MRYMTALAIRRDRIKRELEMMGEKEREEKKEIERKLREEILKVENDGSLEEFIKQKRSSEGDNEFVKQIRYEPNQLDITPLMKQVQYTYMYFISHTLHALIYMYTVHVHVRVCIIIL